MTGLELPLGLTRWLSAAIVALIVVATLAAYWPALDNALLVTWDTQAYVTGNPMVLSLSVDNLRRMLTDFHYANWHPLTWFSHAIDYAVYGEMAAGHHLTSVLIHALNASLVVVLALRLYRIRPWPVVQHPLLASGLAGLLFAIHPQHVESVAWVAERKDVLCQLFVMLGLISYCQYVKGPMRGLADRWYWLVLVCHLLALLAKSMAVTFPLILLIIDAYRIDAETRRATDPDWRRLLGQKVPMLLLSFGAGLLTLGAQHNSGALASVAAAGLEVRILNAINSIVFYVSKWLIPIHFSPYYPYPSFTTAADYLAASLALVGIVLASGLAWFAWCRGLKFWLAAWVFYIVTLMPVIGLIQVGGQAAADRYAYLPTLPWYIILSAWVVGTFASLRKRSIRLCATGALMAIVLGLGLKTRAQTDIWQSDVTLWGHVVRFTPESALAHSQLGNAYYIVEKDYRRAVHHFRQAISIEPDNLHWYRKLPRAYIRAGLFGDALELIDHLLAHRVDIGYESFELYYLKAYAHYGQGEFEPARESLEFSLQLAPANDSARQLLRQIDVLARD